MNRRKAPIVPADMSEAQRALYEEIAHGSRAAESAFPLVDDTGALTGPFDAMLLEPRIGRALQAVGAALRFHGSLTDRAREMAILMVGHHHDSDFEVFAHEAVGRRIGLSEADLADLAAKRAPRSADACEAAVLDVASRLLQDGDFDDETYHAVVGVLGEEGIFEVNAVVGYYSLLATQLKVFGVSVPARTAGEPAGAGG